MNTPKKKSSVRHTRAIGRDRQKHPSGDVSPEQIEALFEEVVHPATLEQVAEYKRRGHRERTLTLPIMTALVLSLLWRQLGSVREAVRLLNEEGVLWTGPVTVTASAVTDRLRTLPSELFRGVLYEVLPRLHARWEGRDRPLPPAVAWARDRYTALLALDGSTLDALQKKVSLSDALPEHKGLAGRMAALLDVASHLPHEVWHEEDSAAHDQTFWERALEAVKPGALLLFDLGFVNYGFFDRLTYSEVTFITRLKANASFQVVEVLREGPKVRDVLVTLGKGSTRCEETLRVVAVLYGGKWYRYLTNELDPAALATEHVVALYWQRWRIEDAYATVKRLLGLSYFTVNSINGIRLQLWATWVLYAVLADLTDAVAQRLQKPYQLISVEMVYRGLAHFTRALRRGAATDPVEYLAQKAKLLGIVKQQRPKSLDILHLLTTQLNP